MSMWVKQCHWHHPFGHGKHSTQKKMVKLRAPLFSPHDIPIGSSSPVGRRGDHLCRYRGLLRVWRSVELRGEKKRGNLGWCDSQPMGIKRATPPQKSTFDADLRLSRGGWDDEKDGRIYIYIYNIQVLAGKGWDLTAKKMGSEAPLHRDGTKQQGWESSNESSRYSQRQ